MIDSIELKNITKWFKQKSEKIVLFNNCSYIFNADKSYAITGPSGSGKSTLLYMLAQIEQPSSGSIISSCDQKKISLILQHPTLLQELTALENCMLSGIIGNDTLSSAKQKALTILGQVQIAQHADQLPMHLSGGQQQRVCLARALYRSPRFLIADEPTGSLDGHNAQEIINLLLWYKKEYHLGLIISTHDPKIASYCDVQLKVINQDLLEVRP